MVLAYHLILTAYGFWLPNDPRGSWSEFVGAWELLRYGKATKIDVRRSVAHHSHDTCRRSEAKTALKYPPVRFDGSQALAIAHGFAAYTTKSAVDILACAILPDHVHLVVARHRLSIEQIANQLKGAATRRLITKHMHPLRDVAGVSGRLPSPWARGCWTVYLNTEQSIDRAIHYVENNPLKDGLKRQRWSFVCERGG